MSWPPFKASSSRGRDYDGLSTDFDTVLPQELPEFAPQLVRPQPFRH